LLDDPHCIDLIIRITDRILAGANGFSSSPNARMRHDAGKPYRPENFSMVGEACLAGGRSLPVSAGGPLQIAGATLSTADFLARQAEWLLSRETSVPIEA
jgi:hypothetical protein